MGFLYDDRGGRSVLGIVGGIFGFTFQLIGRTFQSLSNGLQIWGINRQNRKNQSVEERRGLQPLSGLVSEVSATGRTVISGNPAENPSPWRDAAAVSVIRKVSDAGVGVIVLHRGNQDLVARIQEAVPSRLVIADRLLTVYDPLRDMDASERKDILSDAILRDGRSLSDTELQYLEGLLLCLELCRKNGTLVQAAKLSKSSIDALRNTMDDRLASGRITREQHDEAIGLLMSGLVSASAVRSYLNALMRNYSSFCVQSTTAKNSEMTSFGRTLQRGNVLAMDLSSITNGSMCYGILVNELKYALQKTRKGYLVLDNLNFMECAELYKLLADSSGMLGICLSMDDLFVHCGSDEDKFKTLVGPGNPCIVFRHNSNPSAKAWENQFGTYRKIEMTEGLVEGSMRPSPFALFAGRNTARDRRFAPKDEPRVYAKDILDLQDGNVYVIRNGQSALRCVLADA